jgi:Zn-dependent protease
MDPQFDVLPPVPPSAPPPAQPKKNIFQSIGGWLAAGFIAVAKFKFLLFGALKTGLSMFVSIWIYAQLFGWVYAAGIVALIFVHEMGHVIAAKWLGMPVSAPLFIPFIGASIIMKENPRDAWTEALMAYGGPLAGCIGSWICWFVAMHYELNWLMAVASTSFFINIFNMIPVPPLDGGRMCAAVSPWFWIVGIVPLLGSLFLFHGPNAIIIIILVLFAAFQRFKQTFFGTPTPEMQDYYNTHLSKRLTMVVMYIALLASLLLGYAAASESLNDLVSDSTYSSQDSQ